MPLAVRMTGIDKAFGAVRALKGVDLEVEAGTLHGVVGENGAGKTTLMRILYGAASADSGAIEVDGRHVAYRTPAQAIVDGVGMVSQHYGVIPGLTCLQNLMLGAEPGAVLDVKSATARAVRLAEEMGFTFDWFADAEGLSPAACQKLEILKLLWKGARIMILDEPTAMLSPLDGEALFGSLKRLVGRGATVVLVTHRLPEVMDHCQRVTVLRAGERIVDLAVATTTASEVAELIVGGSLSPQSVREQAPGDVLLKVADLNVLGDRGNVALANVDFEVRAGEVVGIAGVDGSGQRELVRALLGLAKPTKGDVVYMNASIIDASPAKRLSLGLRTLPEDRIAEAEIESWSLELNAALGLQRQPALATKSRVNRPERLRLAAAIADRFNTRHGGLQMPIASLSGGNQQRFIAARTLALGPELIVGFQPARGLDLLGVRSVYDGIRDACSGGSGALIVSFDLDELLENCDRVLVLFGGRMAVPPSGQERDRAVIGRLMVGAN
ncbi:MAG: ABC transporter ATP-binding protein [Fimbriimonadaceae bacterium]